VLNHVRSEQAADRSATAEVKDSNGTGLNSQQLEMECNVDCSVDAAKTVQVIFQRLFSLSNLRIIVLRTLFNLALPNIFQGNDEPASLSQSTFRTLPDDPMFFDNIPEARVPPLCSHTECTADDVLIMCLSVGFRHNLTWVAIIDMMKMVNAIYGVKKVKASKYSVLERLFKDINIEATYHYFCSSCSVYVCPMKKEIRGKETCNVVCNFCGKVVNNPKGTTYFASLHFEAQLKKLLENDEIASMIMNYRFNRQKLNEENLEDIYDGSEYRKLSFPGGILSLPQNFSYSFFTDGVPVGKAKKSLWPIYVTINELPPKERKRNMLLIGLYHGAHDPDLTVFLAPFVAEANKLSTEGFSWVNSEGSSVNSKVIPLVAVSDSVARCQLLNMQTFSAHNGCTFCYQKTERTVKRLKYVTQVDPPVMRTRKLYARDLQESYKRQSATRENDRQYKGVKGPSSLASLFYFNLFTGFVVDYLHNILLGVTKTYFELLFQSTNRKFWNLLESDIYAMEDVIAEIDARLTKITPPTCISRTPRTIKDWSSWKANEWRSFLLFYSIPCLKGLLKDKYLVHFTMLAKGTSLLLQKSVSQRDVDEAHSLFLKFTFLYEKYFGKEFMYYNIHLLSHVCIGVLRFGPLWTHNSFMYESQNRHLLQLCKNPFRVVKEVCTKYLILQDLPRLVDVLARNDITLFFCEQTLNFCLLNSYKSGPRLLGAANCGNLSEGEKELLSVNGFSHAECLYYTRVLIRGMRFTTMSYANNMKNNDSFIIDVTGDILQIISIMKFAKDDILFLTRRVIVIELPVLRKQDYIVSHIHALHKFSELKLVTPDRISGQYILADTKKDMYLSEMPFGCYGD